MWPDILFIDRLCPRPNSSGAATAFSPVADWQTPPPDSDSREAVVAVVVVVAVVAVAPEEMLVLVTIEKHGWVECLDSVSFPHS